MEKEIILKDVDIQKIASKLRTKALKSVAVIFLGLRQNEVEDFDDECDDDTQLKRKLIITWRNRDIKNNKPLLANILHNSGIIEEQVIIDTLGSYKFTSIPFPKPSNKPNLIHNELGRLVKEITMKDMERVAIECFGFTDVDVTNIKADNKKDDWSAKFQILVDGCNKSRKTRQGLLDFIQTQGIGNQNEILKILGNGGAPQTSPPGAPSPSPSSEVCSSSQTVHMNGINGISTEPKDLVGRSNSQLDGREPADPAHYSVRHGRDLKGTPLATVDDLERYDWLKFKEIIKITEKVGRTTRPVVVAVLDTGIWEEHPRLKRAIITEKSYCVLKGEAEEDLKEDWAGHGTMVAGVIALKGPVNVKILNIKLADMTDTEVMTALEYIEKLDGTHNAVDIINMSFECPDKMSDTLHEKIKNMSSEKIIIAAAGNDGATSSDPVSWIAQHPNVICVGACNENGHRCDFSSVGREVDFLCPGKEVTTTWSRHTKLGEELQTYDGKYVKIDGTSFAAPHACAAAAHLLVTIEALIFQDARVKGKTSDEAKEEADLHRKALRKTEKMSIVLREMCDPPVDGKSGVLQPYTKCFKNQSFEEKEKVVFGNKSWASFYEYCEKANIFNSVEELKKKSTI